MTLDELIKNNYDYILKCAKKIAKNEAEDLVNCTYISIFDRKGFEFPQDNEGAVKVFVKYLHLNYTSQKRAFNADKRTREVLIGNYEAKDLIEDGSEVDEIELKEFKETLNEPELIVYELHYEEDISLRSIAEEFKRVGLGEKALRKINKNITEKINNKWKQ
nr:hypothetical protein [uncultured Flavobacterium sp.]